MVLTLKILWTWPGFPAALPSPVRGRTCPAPDREARENSRPVDERPMTLTLNITWTPSGTRSWQPS
jgi:hypothetical protein